MCSESVSLLKTLGQSKSGTHSDLVVELLVPLYETEQAGGSVGFLWIPVDVGVEGSEERHGCESAH